MRRGLSALLLLICVAPAVWALSVVSTFPSAYSENFLPTDTLRLTFDQSPAGQDVELFIHGVQAAYPVADVQADGNDLHVFPSRPWFVGDRITVWVGGAAIRYVFEFTVHAVGGRIPELTARPSRLRYHRLPRALAASDLDADGAIDLAILFTDTLGVARQQGGEPYYSPAELSWDDGGHPACDAARVLRAGDLNEDGYPELVTTDPVRNTLRVYRNESVPGHVEFDDPVALILELNGPSDVQIADVNSDGHLDLIAVGISYEPDLDRLVILIGDGALHFTTSDWALTGLDPSAVAIADVDVDGDLDMLVSCRGSRSVQLFRNYAVEVPSFAISMPVSSLPSGPDGLLIDNLTSCWDDAGDAQLPDLLVWSRGVHNLRERGPLDEDPYLLRFRNSGGTDFVDPVSIPAPTVIHDATTGDLDATVATPDNNLIVIGQSDLGDTLVWMYNDDVATWWQLDSVRSPVSSLTFDVDLDGDLDPFFIDYGSGDVGDEEIVYYAEGDSSNVVCWLSFPLTPIDGSLDSLTCYYRNGNLYPISVHTILDPSDPQFSILRHPDLPFTLAAGDSVPMVFGFQPTDSGLVGPAAAWVLYRMGPLSRSNRIVLQGGGGRSLLQSSPAHDPSMDTLFVDFGFIESGNTAERQILLANHGNYPLDVGYDRNRLFHFQVTDFADSVAPYSTAARPTTIRFTPPIGSTDSNYTEYLTVYDSTFFHADGFGALNGLITDTLTYLFRIHVVVNQLPYFVFPNQTVHEDQLGVFSIMVMDPNSPPSLDTVRVLYDGIRPFGASLSTTPPAFQPVYRRSPFSLPFQVDSNVAAPAEVCTLSFTAWDAQFSERFADTTWVVAILPQNDLPSLQLLHDTVRVTEGDSLTNLLLATATDEEGDSLIFDPQWQSAHIPAATFLRPPNALAITWRPTFDEAGVYPLRIRVSERAFPAHQVQDTMVFVVQDVSPDVAALSVIPSVTSIERGGALSISYEIAELRGVPVAAAFSVVLSRVSAGGSRVTLVTETYDRLEAHGTRSRTYHNDRVEICGTTVYTVLMTPQGPDADVTNNYRDAIVTVRCPDLAADLIDLPTTLHKQETFEIRATLREVNQAAVTEPFTAVLRVSNRVGTFDLAAFQYQSLVAGGSITEHVNWQSDTCNEHRIVWEIQPPVGLDTNPGNDVAQRSTMVECDPFQVWPLPFTPNDDGYNDTLYFDLGDDRFKSPAIEIFYLDGRAVTKLHEVRAGAICWNGRDRNGQNCAPGAYMYVFSDSQRKLQSGLIYVVR